MFFMVKNEDYIILKYPESYDVPLEMIKSKIKTINNIGKYDIHRDYLHALIHQILDARKNFQVKVDNFKKDICFPVSAELLKNTTRNYKVYLEHLIETKFIARLTDSEKGKCCTYQICSPHDKSPLKPYCFFKKLNKKFNTVFKSLIAKPNVDHCLVDKFSCQIASYKKLSIDVNKANNLLLELYPDNEDQVDIQSNLVKTLNDFSGDDSIESLNTFHCDKQGRLYTPFTTVNKKLRPYFKLNGSPLHEIDLSNSIPFFGLALLLDTNENSYINKRIKEICKEREEELGKNLYKGVILRKTGLEHEKDVQQYKALVCNGGIYEELGSIWGMGKKEAKYKYLELCNTPPIQLFENNYWDKFSYYFPNVSAAIEDVNRYFTETKKQARKNKRFMNRRLCAYAIITQTLESDFMLSLIMPQVQDTNPEVSMISLHDAIYTTSEYSGLISVTIQDVCLNYIGFSPSTKIKELDVRPSITTPLINCVY